MAMSEFEKKLLKEFSGIRKELAELNKEKVINLDAGDLAKTLNLDKQNRWDS